MLRHCISASMSGAGPSVIQKFVVTLVQCLGEGLVEEGTRALRQHTLLLRRHCSTGLSVKGNDTTSADDIEKFAVWIDLLLKKYNIVR